MGVKISDFQKVLNERLKRNGIWKDAIDIPNEYIENYIDITEDITKDLDILIKSGLLGRELENNCNKIKIDNNMYYDIDEGNSINLTAKELITMYEKDQKNADKNLLFELEDYISVNY